MTHAQLLQLLRRKVRRYGTQTALSSGLDISPAYLSDILKGKREPGAKVLASLGLRRIVRYEHVL